MTAQAGLWTTAAMAALLAAAASFAEWRRQRRRDLDRVGWVPWSAIQIAAFFAALIAVALAINS